MLINNITLPQKYRPHKLTGDHYPKWECHIEPDWLLIYEIKKDIIILYRTGTHSDLF
ncbi:mRNA interferase toxin YafQ [Rickettsia tillamookensis]|uniref:mRNA interferase toxin YafQ n=1 Tax=Rickettsia tillamookensis TaxID=2761623 RepID=A0A9E6SQH8_9RICK|nr:type II toxin-antitoxin system YafQ family toxin [Rickettsia tillamookensis]QQV75238.1 mRNA interferase toxin YafQ [Rickettsia tillamookensis]